MNNKGFIIVALIIILAAGGYVLLRQSSSDDVQSLGMSGDENSEQQMGESHEGTVSTTSLSAASSTSVSSTTTIVPNEEMNENNTGNAEEKKYTVSYTDSGYSPNTVTIHVGDTVTFVNNSSRDMWTASDVHPVHSAYDGTTLQEHCANQGPTTFDSCGGVAPEGTWSFTFTKAGTWHYHNHRNPRDTGTVVVEQ